MGRLDDIIARNTKPSARARPSAARPLVGARPSGAAPGERLAAIVARNAPRPWYANKLVRGLVFAALVLICLALVAFTNLAKPHVDAKPAPAGAASHAPADHVDGVYLSPGAKRHP